MLRSWSDSSFRIAPAGSQAATLLWTADRILPYEQASPPERSSAEGAPPATLVRRVRKPSNDGKIGISGLLVLVLRTFIKELSPRESEATSPFLVLWPNDQRVADVTDPRATADKALFGRC